jgi:hypothetical protein
MSQFVEDLSGVGRVHFAELNGYSGAFPGLKTGQVRIQ